MKSNDYAGHLQLGEWRISRASGEITGPSGTQRLEPKVADLLFLLAAQPGQPVTREQIMASLWPGQVVGEDSLARAVFKLRQALGDDARTPRYVETLSKRGYRLLVEPQPGDPVADTPRVESAPIVPEGRGQGRRLAMGVGLLAAIALLAWWFAELRPRPAPDAGSRAALVAQADDFYFQFSRGDNESAIELYERVLGLDPDDANALAGLANALVQRSIRWPELPGEQAVQFARLGDALAHGHLARAPASLQIERARRLAERAVVLSPGLAAAHKAAGFVASAQGRLDAALQAYDRALAIDPDAWGVLINIGDVLEISGRRPEALPYFERAYAAMERGYATHPVQIRPWQARLGALIAQRHASQGDASAAEAWYRRVLSRAPLHPEATRGLARLLRAAGELAEAHRLCTELASRVGPEAGCDAESKTADPG